MHLFISSVSDDPIVVLKTISTIRPDKAILLVTEKAREKRWNTALGSIRKITGIDINPLNIPEHDAELESVARRIENKLNENAPSKITADCTTGRGLFRIGIVDVCRNYAQTKNIEFSVCYNDGDKKSVRIINDFGKNYTEDKPVPIEVKFNSISDRLSLYGANIIEEYVCFIKNGTVLQNNPSLITHLFSSLDVRMYFGNFLSMCQEWAKRKKIEIPKDNKGKPDIGALEFKFREEYFANYSDRAIFDFLGKKSFTTIFENIISNMCVDIISKDKKLTEIVSGVFGGIKVADVKESRKAKFEIDTLILLKTGDIVALETKTAFGLANISSQKDLESRIKNIRDFTGAYTKWALIFPFTREDLHKPTDKYLQGFAYKTRDSWHSKDKRILMIDELESYLKETILGRVDRGKQ
ncbi:MAG TPA: hypothetical protein PLB16_07240 [bacterium]|nr:hypothetical protein [bacterium]